MIKQSKLKRISNRITRCRLPAMMTLEAAYIVPMFFLIIFGAVCVAVDVYTDIRIEAEDIKDNTGIDAAKNFRYASLGKDVISSIGGSK